MWYNNIMIQNKYTRKDETIIDEKIPTPILYSKKCKYIAIFIYIILVTAPIIVALYFWITYDVLASAASFLLSYLVAGIFKATIRNKSIPVSQQEHFYSDRSITTWYTSIHLCNDELETKLEKIDKQ